MTVLHLEVHCWVFYGQELELKHSEKALSNSPLNKTIATALGLINKRYICMFYPHQARILTINMWWNTTRMI